MAIEKKLKVEERLLKDENIEQILSAMTIPQLWATLRKKWLNYRIALANLRNAVNKNDNNEITKQLQIIQIVQKHIHAVQDKLELPRTEFEPIEQILEKSKSNEDQ